MVRRSPLACNLARVDPSAMLMKEKLFLCSGCGRHVKECSHACPFCGRAVSSVPCLDSVTVARRLTRAALLTSASTMLALSGCSTYGNPPCPHEIDFLSPCGFQSVTTTCTGATLACEHVEGGLSLDQCSLKPVTASCAFTTTLGDSSTHTTAITVGSQSGCGGDVIISPSGGTVSVQVDLTSGTCRPPPDLDSGVDGTDDAADGSSDAADADLPDTNG